MKTSQYIKIVLYHRVTGIQKKLSKKRNLHGEETTMYWSILNRNAIIYNSLLQDSSKQFLEHTISQGAHNIAEVVREHVEMTIKERRLQR